jgi:cytochrome c
MGYKCFGVALLVLLPTVFAAAGDGTSHEIFEKRCGGCHSLSNNRVGPPLAGVVGRKAGAIEDFPYSDALKNSGIVWSEANLDRWLSNPDSVVPDNDMTFRLNNAEERLAIIAYLKGR